MPSLTERLALLITGDSSSAVSAFSQVGGAARKAAGEAQGSTTAAGSALARFGITGGVAMAAGFTAAGAVLTKFALDGVEKFAELTGQVRAFQRVTGATPQEASQLVAAVNLLGIDADRTGTAIFRMAKNLDGQRESLKNLGVDIAYTADGNVDLTNTFLNVADAVAKAGAGFKADEITAAAFGSRVGKDLLPVLLRGRDGLQELFDAAAKHHEIFTAADLEKGRQLTLATRELHQAFTGLEVEAGRALVPAITKVTELTIGVLELADSLGGQAVDDLHRFTEGLQTLPLGARFVHGLGIEWEYVAKALHLTKDAGVDVAKVAKDAADKQQQQVSSLSGVEGAAKTYRSAVAEVGAALKAVGVAQDAEARKAKDQADADADATKAAAELTSAENDLAEAQRRAPLDLAQKRRELADATFKVEDADKDALVALEKYGRGSLQAREAAQGVADAKLDQADAADKVAAAERAGARTDAVVAAETRIASAKQAQADAAERKTKADAEDPYTEMADAEQRLRDAKINELATQDKLKTSLDDFNRAFGTTLTTADALSTSLDEILLKWQQIQTGVPEPLGPGIQGPLLPGQTRITPAPLAPGIAGPLLPGQERQQGPVPPIVQNINVNVTTNADPAEIAAQTSRQVAVAARFRPS